MTKYDVIEGRAADGNFKCIRYMDIVFIMAGANEIRIMVGKIVYTHPCSLDDFMFHTLSLGLFCRAHYKYIANMDRIDGYGKTTLELVMDNESRISFSQEGLKAYLLLKKPSNIVRIIKTKIKIKLIKPILKIVKKIKKRKKK